MFCELVEHPVQILIVFALDVDLFDGVQNRGVMLAAELATNLRE
jgi:hypothetical protein